MNTEQKSESTWEEAEQLGPYQIHEQVPQSGRGQGELYRATNLESGTAALVLKPGVDHEGGSHDWQVRCIASTSPQYTALEVEHSPWSVAPDKHSVESLMFVFEDVRAAVKRMERALPDSHEPRHRWRPGPVLAVAAAVVVLTFALVRLVPVSQPLGSANDSLAQAGSAPMNPEVSTDASWVFLGGSSLVNTVDAGVTAIARAIPDKPFKDQRRPPCKPRVETEISGGCWIPHELKAPCPEELYEYQGKCYTYSAQPQRPPQSLEQ